MRKLLFNYSFYSHPEIGNFRVWHCNSHRASREFQVPLRVVIGWFKWTPMPRSIRVGSWSGDSIFIQVGSGDSSFFQKFTVDQPNDFLFCHNWGIPLVMAPLVKYNHDKLFLYKSNYTFFSWNFVLNGVITQPYIDAWICNQSHTAINWSIPNRNALIYNSM
jgi:hypothetical protein